MGKQSITEIEAGLGEWDFLKELPQEIDGFKLTAGTGIKGQILNIASYVNEPMHCRLDLTYTTETFDYVPVKTIGLHTFRDERFFCRDRDKFARLMTERLPEIIGEVDRNHRHAMSHEAASMGFEQWEYWRTLPEKIGGYERFLTPDNPVSYINGSMLFLDYTDFAAGNQVYFLYNGFRNEIFAELKRHYLPVTTNRFDAENLDGLSLLLDKYLLSTLEELEK